ncbi:DUF3466 family protein, partial [Planctomycetota bacterium]
CGAFGINNLGQIVGDCDAGWWGEENRGPVLWDGSGVQKLPIDSVWVPRLGHDGLHDISNTGEVIGTGVRFGFSWEGGTPRLLPPPSTPGAAALGLDDSVALAVNDHGVVVGYARRPDTSTTAHAVAWINGTPIDIGEQLDDLYPGPYPDPTLSKARGVNNRGQVVGYWAWPGRNVNRGFIWQAGEVTVIDPLVGSSASAYDINDRGEVLVSMGQGPSVWRDGEVWNLNQSIAGDSQWHVLELRKINNLGQILATGGRLDTLEVRNILLSPTASGLVVAAHGWQPAWKAPDVSWAYDMANNIALRATETWPEERMVWETRAWDWSEDAHTLDPLTALAHARLHGQRMAREIVQSGVGYDHAHFIAHSAGSYLISAAAAEIREHYPDLFPAGIHLTFLDSAAPGLLTMLYANALDPGRDWSDHYFVSDPVPYTQERLHHSHNVDLTWYAALEGDVSHGFPVGWYADTVLDPYGTPGTVQGARSYGFSRSMEAGAANWAASFGPEYQVGNGFLPWLRPRPWGLLDWATAMVVVSDTGSVGVGDVGLAMVTGSPVWAETVLSPGGQWDYLSFSYQFLGDGDGLLSVYVDDVLIYLAAQEFDELLLQETGVIFVGDLGRDGVPVRFELTSLNDDPAGIWLSDISYGEIAVVPEPSGLGLVCLGACMLLRRWGARRSRR